MQRISGLAEDLLVSQEGFCFFELLLLLLLLLLLSPLCRVSTHISETNHVPRGYLVAAMLPLWFMVIYLFIIIIIIIES